MPDRRTLLIILITLTLTTLGLGRDIPFDTTAPAAFVFTLTLFIAYLYFCRTLVRLPVALVITIRRARQAHQKYGLDSRESLRDGLARGFLDTRRWSVSPLSLMDRLSVVGFTLLATIPFLGVFLVRFGGFCGLALLLILYLIRGKFTLLVEDNLDSSAYQAASLPFINLDR